MALHDVIFFVWKFEANPLAIEINKSFCYKLFNEPSLLFILRVTVIKAEYLPFNEPSVVEYPDGQLPMEKK